MSDIRKFVTGPRVLRNRLNEIIGGLNRSSNVIGDGFVKVRRTQSGWTIGLDIDKLRPRVWNRQRPLQLHEFLIGWWLFNGDYQDSSGNDYDLANTGGSIEDNTYKLAGSQYADAGAKLIPATGDWTVTGWFNTSDASAQTMVSQGITSAGDIRFMIHVTSHTFQVTIGGGPTRYSTETDLNDGKRHFFAMVRSGNYFDMYLDGIHTSTQAEYSGEIAQNINFRIGRLGTSTSYDFKGNLDDIRIYKKGLTDWEIRRVHEEGLKDTASAGKVFEVQSAATGDGVYNCYQQTFDATEWDDTDGDDKFDDKDTTAIEVFNLLESNPDGTYKQMLAIGDRIRAWQLVDDEGNRRWAGVPITGGFVRSAKTTQAAPADTKITANLIGQDGDEITSGLGANIDVYCDITGGANLQQALPYLANGQWISVYNQRGMWKCTQLFQKWGICT